MKTAASRKTKPSRKQIVSRRNDKLNLEIRAQAGKHHVRFLQSHILQAHSLMKFPIRELSVALVGPKQMARLHHQFLGQTGPTDVLTFEMDRDAKGLPVAGEIVICVPIATEQAKIHGHSTRHELLLYAIHGLLHLSGFDDNTPRNYRAMHRKEDEILTRLGVGKIFGQAGNPAAKRRRAGAGLCRST